MSISTDYHQLEIPILPWYLVQLAVKTHNGVGGINKPVHCLMVLEIGAEIGPVGALELGAFRLFFVTVFPKMSRAARVPCVSTAV